MSQCLAGGLLGHSFRESCLAQAAQFHSFCQYVYRANIRSTL
ncbi:hypothetical protein BN1007_140004 [Klebsiella variicola]|nr:hypothetical protein [Klebsiella pneumoniae ISC21]CTQ05398.1 hypothetical protein BN1007_140004 [Klebsiella variicola]